MSVQPYRDEQVKRFGELAELFLRCRAAWRAATVETEGHPSPGSLAARDQREVAEHLAKGRPHVALVIPSAVQRYMLAASEQFGGLAALYEAQEVLYSPANLARSLIEHCASAAWVLGTDGEPVRNRLARLAERRNSHVQAGSDPDDRVWQLEPGRERASKCQ